MADARESQINVEVVETNDPDARMSQICVEVVRPNIDIPEMPLVFVHS